MNTPKIYVVPALSVEEYRPHPEELAKQASRRMDATHGLAAILRDARKGALLRMRSEKWFTAAFAGTTMQCALRVIPVFGIRRRLDRGGQHWNGLILRRDIHRLVVWVFCDLLDRGFVDEGVFRNQARLGIRDVMAEQRFSRPPFLVRIRPPPVLERAPGGVHRVVRLPGGRVRIGRIGQETRFDIAERAVLPLPAPAELIDGGAVDPEAAFHGFLDHPQQRVFRQPALYLRVAATDIGMHAGEPDLQGILRPVIVGVAKPGGPEDPEYPRRQPEQPDVSA